MTLNDNDKTTMTKMAKVADLLSGNHNRSIK